MPMRSKWAYSCMWNHNTLNVKTVWLEELEPFCGADAEKELADAAADLTTWKHEIPNVFLVPQWQN